MKLFQSGNKSLGFYYNVMRAGVVGPLTLFLWLLMSTSDHNLFTQKANWSGQMKVSWSATITLSKVTRVKQVTRSTVNCVLLSALAGALRILLQSCGVRQPPDLRVSVVLKCFTTLLPLFIIKSFSFKKSVLFSTAY